MAGHSQFKNIMYRKGVQDTKRAKTFAKISREIMVAARMGSDPYSNPRLRTALSAARSANMPRDNVERALKRVTSGTDQTSYEEARYEGFGPSNIAFVVECLTDSRQRTAAHLRSAFTRHGGHLGEIGCTSYLFDHVGVMQLPTSVDFDMLFEVAAQAGADSVDTIDNLHEVVCSFQAFVAVRDALMLHWADLMQAQAAWRPRSWIAWDETQETLQKLQRLFGTLEEDDDVQDYFVNARLLPFETTA